MIYISHAVDSVRHTVGSIMNQNAELSPLYLFL